MKLVKVCFTILINLEIKRKEEYFANILPLIRQNEMKGK